MKNRCMSLFGTRNGRPIGEVLCEELDKMEKPDLKASSEFIQKYANVKLDSGDPLEAQFHSIRLIETNTIIPASTNFSRFFETVTLADNEQAELINSAGIETSFSYVGDGNKPRVQNVDKDTTTSFINMKNLSTERVRYPLVDLQRGRIDEIHKATLDLANDWAGQLDLMCYTLLSAAASAGGAYGAFTTTGTKSARTYMLKNSSRIVTANLPSTNDITVGSPTSSTYFDIATLKAIVKYASQWGSYGLVPTGEIIVPSIDVDGITNGISTIATLLNPVGEQILLNGWFGLSYLGVNWRFVPDNTLATGTCYPIFNKPVGKLFLKPGLDKDRTKRDDDENWEEAWQIRPLALVMPWANRINTARFTYRTA